MLHSNKVGIFWGKWKMPPFTQSFPAFGHSGLSPTIQAWLKSRSYPPEQVCMIVECRVYHYKAAVSSWLRFMNPWTWPTARFPTNLAILIPPSQPLFWRGNEYFGGDYGQNYMCVWLASSIARSDLLQPWVVLYYSVCMQPTFLEPSVPGVWTSVDALKSQHVLQELLSHLLMWLVVAPLPDWPGRGWTDQGMPPPSCQY